MGIAAGVVAHRPAPSRLRCEGAQWELWFEAVGDLRHGRVARFVLADPDEAAAPGDLEGAHGPVDRVGDAHGRSLADSLGTTANPARGFYDECYRRPMAPSPTTPALEPS
jgi:hypothetical protein